MKKCVNPKCAIPLADEIIECRTCGTRQLALEMLRARRDEILHISAKHGARNVRVFGSVARGEAGPESDVDFLVDVGPDRTPFFPGGLLADLEDLLGRKVDIVTEDALHWYIRQRVLKEALPL